MSGLGIGVELHVGDMVYLRFRDLDPTLGRFTTNDPLSGVPGTTTVSNQYSYAGNDPVGAIDPFGLRPDDSGFTVDGGPSGSGLAEILGAIAELDALTTEVVVTRGVTTFQLSDFSIVRVWTFLAVTVVLLIVMIGVAFGELLSGIAGGRIPEGLLWILIALKMPQVLGTIVPLSVFVSVIWGLGRLYRDQEMSVMRSSGFRWQMMLRPLFNLLLPIVAALLALGLFVSPLAAQATQQKLMEAFRNASEWGLQPGTFHVLRDGKLVLYVESVDKDGQTLRNVLSS